MDDTDNPCKHIFHRENFRAIPRWPNDGIEQYKRQDEARRGVEASQMPLYFPIWEHELSCSEFFPTVVETLGRAA